MQDMSLPNWMRMFTIPNQSSVAKAYLEFSGTVTAGQSALDLRRGQA